jgi:hypothetical protein
MARRRFQKQRKRGGGQEGTVTGETDGTCKLLSKRVRTETIEAELMLLAPITQTKMMEYTAIMQRQDTLKYRKQQLSQCCTITKAVYGISKGAGRHWYQVHNEHTSTSCKNPNEGHNKEATKSNPMGIVEWGKEWCGGEAKVIDHKLDQLALTLDCMLVYRPYRPVFPQPRSLVHHKLRIT